MPRSKFLHILWESKVLLWDKQCMRKYTSCLKTSISCKLEHFLLPYWGKILVLESKCRQNWLNFVRKFCVILIWRNSIKLTLCKQNQSRKWKKSKLNLWSRKSKLCQPVILIWKLSQMLYKRYKLLWKVCYASSNKWMRNRLRKKILKDRASGRKRKEWRLKSNSVKYL